MKDDFQKYFPPCQSAIYATPRIFRWRFFARRPNAAQANFPWLSNLLRKTQDAKSED
jgi:hypothetical protein